MCAEARLLRCDIMSFDLNRRVMRVGLQFIKSVNMCEGILISPPLILQCTVLCCQHCGKEVTNKNDVFSMAAEGPLGAYVNPGGHVHDTLTVHRARGLQLVGHPSSQHSWFPGQVHIYILIVEIHSVSRFSGNS